MHWLDRLTAEVAPRWTLRRQQARAALDLVARHYEGASTGRRTQGWRRSSGDPNASIGPSVGRLRDVARDLVRNNPHAESALRTIVDDAVGWGIVAKTKNARALEAWNAWAGSTACDAQGQHDFYGLQKLVMQTVVESGEVLVRRRIRRLEDNLPIPVQLQVLEPDVLDTTKVGTLPGGGRIVHGVELDAIGRRVAYWLLPEHPGSVLGLGSISSQRVPASSVLHIFKGRRPGQLRGVSWYAPVLLRFKDFDEFEDATLMKQKIAACLAVITSDVDGTAPPLGTADRTQSPELDLLEPGAILNVPPGRDVNVVQPPTVREYSDYVATSLRAIAAGLGVTYEDLTGDYTDLPFSAARMSRLRHWARVEDWRWRLLVPQFCGPVWGWAMQAALIAGVVPDVAEEPAAKWTAPPMAMIEPDKEGLAYARNIRAGIMTLPEALRELGYDPEEVLVEMAASNKLLDKLGLVLDSDGRKMTQAGQLQGEAALTSADRVAPEAAEAPPPAEADGEEEAARRLVRWK